MPNYLDTDDSSGLLGHFIGTVKTSWWSTPMAETNGEQTAEWAQETRLYWDVSVDDVLQEFGDTVPESLTLSFTCGKGWLADVAGREVRHKDAASDEEVEAGTAKPKLFRSDSVYGRFVAMIIGKFSDWGDQEILDDGGEIVVDLDAVSKFLTDHRTPDPRDAKVWEGIQWEFRGMGRSWTDRQGKEMPAHMKALPVRMLGANDVAETSSPDAPFIDNAADLWGAAGADVPTLSTLTALRNAASSHTEFMKNAALLPAVKDNEALLKVIEENTDGPWS